MQKALAPVISTWPDDYTQLLGSNCGSCGATAFPVQQRCPKCSAGDMAQVLLPRRGPLVAWTTQGFPPGPPYKGPTGKAFVPAKLEFGMPVELTMIPFTTDDEGND